VLGHDYAHNDHVALTADLALIHECGLRVVSLDALVDGLSAAMTSSANVASSAEVAITFDDGPVYDVRDFDHPEFGHQRGFLNILRDFQSANARDAQPGLHATSFVIASPDARKCMEATYDAAHSYVGTGCLSDDWWLPAITTGLLAIGNHSFDHLHVGLPRVAHSRQLRGDFSQVLGDVDADAQIADANVYISQRTERRNAPFFAYPFGQYNAFLTRQYLPANGSRIGLRAAFTTDGRAATPRDSVWSVPRYVCGHHWTSSDQLRAIITGAH